MSARQGLMNGPFTLSGSCAIRTIPGIVSEGMHGWQAVARIISGNEDNVIVRQALMLR